MSETLAPRWLRAVAERLHALGLISTPDAEPPAVASALGEFRALHGLEDEPPVDGGLDPATSDALFWGDDEGACHLGPLPGEVHDADDVRQWLGRAGYAVPSDGSDAAALAEVVRRFQTDAGLTPDGTLGPEEFAVLVSTARERAVAARAEGAPPVQIDEPKRKVAVPRPATLAEGTRGDLVALVQHLLGAQGFACKVDGHFGPKTAAQVRAFDAARGLPDDGAADAGTWQALLAGMEPIGMGAEGAIVEHAQRRLGELGFKPGKADGDFGPNTRDAVVELQRSTGLAATGEVDADTALMLFAGGGGLTTMTRDLRRESLRARMEAALPTLPAAAREKVRRVLEVALSELGIQEVPPGSNSGPGVDAIVAGYLAPQDEARLGKPPWCALAVSSWLCRGLGCKRWSETPFCRRFGAVDRIRRWGEAHGRLSPAEGYAEPGTIFVMRRSSSGSDAAASSKAGHTGMVLADLGDEVLTIEGNVRDAVRDVRRRKDTLTGFVRWW